MKLVERFLLQYLRAARLELSRGSFQPCETLAHLPASSDTSPASGGPIYFVSADRVYWERFGAGFVGSLARHVERPWVHVHFYDVDAADAAASLHGLSKRHPTVEFTWTGEQSLAPDLEKTSPASSKQSWKSLYICCSRFLAARRVMNTYERSILVLDVDTLINGNVRRFFSQANGCDYALMRRPEQWNLCKRTLGGVVYADNTPAGRLFMETACTYIERFLARGNYWFAFDQYALYRALLRLKRVEGLKGFRPLTRQQVSFELALDALICYPKGKSKFGAEFASLAGPLKNADYCSGSTNPL